MLKWSGMTKDILTETPQKRVFFLGGVIGAECWFTGRNTMLMINTIKAALDIRFHNILPRSHGNSVRHHKVSHRSRSSSPEILQNTPTRIRSPARMHPDQRPYSPGDLPLDGSMSSHGASRTRAVSSESGSN